MAIRSGGHSVAGASLTEGGLNVDLRRMNAVSVDPEARTATVAGGATWSDFVAATQPHDLACTGGRVSTTGPESASEPAFSPDGRWILFTRTTGEGPAGVVSALLIADPSEIRKLSLSSGYQYPIWGLR